MKIKWLSKYMEVDLIIGHICIQLHRVEISKHYCLAIKQTSKLVRFSTKDNYLLSLNQLIKEGCRTLLNVI